MEHAKAEELLDAERLRVQSALSDLEEAGREDRAAANEHGEMYDSAEPLAREGVDDSVGAELRERLAAIARAEERLAAGTYGYSLRSGDIIPDNRLEADPTAELTIQEALEAT